MNEMNYQEYFKLARGLEKHHVIFDRIWAVGTPNFSEEIPTACIKFNKIGENIDFLINPKFWETLTDVQKEFVVCHELLHVILYHGIRIKDLPENQLSIANQALDVVVNHTLVNNFDFNRKEFDPTNKYCWVDTVFPDQKVPIGETFEYYFGILKNQTKDSKNTNFNELVDSHEWLESFGNQEFEKKLKDTLSPSDLKQIKELIEKHTKDSDFENQCKKAGCNPGDLVRFADTKKVVAKKKWETVIKKWASKYIKDTTIEQWTRRNRRLSFMPEDFFIPSEQEVEEHENNKIQVWFFQDTSGSCSGFIDRFFAAAKSLPQDKFDVKMHCFDTKVFETTLKSGKLYGFGGTSFKCIEAYIQNHIKNNKLKYPKAVFVITDGYGDLVKPEKPKNWYWFIDGKDYLVPKESNKFNLKDFE